MFNTKLLFNPSMYHGFKKRSHYFEGWYYKIVSADKQQVYAITAGISMGKDGKKHAFIQILNGCTNEISYHKFPFHQFWASSEKFQLTIGNNYFSDDQLLLLLPSFEGRLLFSNTTPWSSGYTSSEAMRWYAYIPFITYHHRITSLHHNISGTLRSADKTSLNFTGGIGYTEKSWGKSLPDTWIWMQSNHFMKQSDNTCLSASITQAPWLGTSFISFAIIFWQNGKLYRFSNYSNAKLQIITLENDLIYYNVSDHSYRLEITVHKSDYPYFISPASALTPRHTKEHMMSSLQIALYRLEKGGKTLIVDDIATHVSLETSGNTHELLSSAQNE